MQWFIALSVAIVTLYEVLSLSGIVSLTVTTTVALSLNCKLNDPSIRVQDPWGEQFGHIVKMYWFNDIVFSSYHSGGR